MAKTRGGARRESAGKKRKANPEATASESDRAKYDVSPEQFVEVWQTSDSADEVADRLKMPKPIVHARASAYREKGIPLKKMKRHTNRGLDVQGLNQLIEKLNKQHGIKAEEPTKAKDKAADLDPKQVKAIVEQVVDTIHRRG